VRQAPPAIGLSLGPMAQAFQRRFGLSRTFSDGRGWVRTSPEGEWCEESSPGAVMDDGRGWFRTSDLSRVKRALSH
jgi:hypothetical protein